LGVPTKSWSLKGGWTHSFSVKPKPADANHAKVLEGVNSFKSATGCDLHF